MYLILASAERFVTEFWRLTPVVALGITTAQIISIVLMIIGIAMTLYLWKAQAMTNGYYRNSKSKAKI
jgi:prolipoprotein diacylglyceryltransferase